MSKYNITGYKTTMCVVTNCCVNFDYSGGEDTLNTYNLTSQPTLYPLIEAKPSVDPHLAE